MDTEIKTKTWKFWNNLTLLSVNYSRDCINEWEKITKFEYEKDSEENIENCKTCICTQKHLIKVFYFKNKYNNNKIKIGSKCIKQFMNIEFEKIKNDRDKLMLDKKELKKQINNRCERCLSLGKTKNCKHCSFINEYAFNLLLDIEYIKKIRIKDKEYKIKPHSLWYRQIIFLNLRRDNIKEIKVLKKQYLDLETILENDYDI
jgi:hypothetical protein